MILHHDHTQLHSLLFDNTTTLDMLTKLYYFTERGRLTWDFTCSMMTPDSILFETRIYFNVTCRIKIIFEIFFIVETRFPELVMSFLDFSP